ncbi:MAG TPA: recombination protein RecR [Candidatus Omnitrophica bacterium]|nr:MAG: recombination protein RecR [Omnitrophica WOR_2 bacterium GWA2_63_20]OGX16177.1 MAG: recombination protein RecR [Omnitrophica WOR_2 bacterium GWF2_63_9]OGX32105.1 MAG: recombination protein RecR [Omnitrophica WOR_2 bacterium RIFCSPHIGHO2_12_FULL_64_13]OGX35156.1 MAG: recombination protein RecR [Omnitrophica WOR_2 bacterium RIFCSPHIGHO2_02_FULL_63_39]OGX45560.1 MAG: recombination protein RecR [Omnitrophica WOR_2 bacterium RIFCSPLOWO2_02_FULL_63_16]OGX48442.1 MAG: recombination protein Re
MANYARSFLRLLEALERLPGIGPRSAERIAFHLLRVPKEQAQQLAQSIRETREGLTFCEVCFNLTESARCEICQDASRDPSILCVVEEPKDVLAIEKTGVFRGLYHVLMGAVAPLDGIGPELLKIDELRRRIAEGTVQEVVIATDADKDGETTAAYLGKLLASHDGLRVTRLALGLPLGSHLEYADHATLARALEGRRAL